ncbi:hypothetical protein LT85_0717 [Collimonas arenae]|uniref:Uncharacterized protein n=1 Tax=Collimonas arenae TaxID=279058 RepID=A0A0A1FAI9_9BURK|nr:hypothetical protein LT85_0717 [Collimonas arenae]
MHLAWFNARNIHFHRRSGCFRPLRRLERGHKSPRCGQTGHATRCACSDEQTTPTGIDLLFDTHTNPNQSKYEKMHGTSSNPRLYRSWRLF